MSLHSTALASADHAHLLTLAHERSLRYGLALRDAPDYQRLASGALRDAPISTAFCASTPPR